MWETAVSRKAQLKAAMYRAKLSPRRHQRRRFSSGSTGFFGPSQLVQRSRARTSQPAARNRELPVARGGQTWTMYRTPVLLAPQRMTAARRPAVMAVSLDLLLNPIPLVILPPLNMQHSPGFLKVVEAVRPLVQEI